MAASTCCGWHHCPKPQVDCSLLFLSKPQKAKDSFIVNCCIPVFMLHRQPTKASPISKPTKNIKNGRSTFSTFEMRSCLLNPLSKASTRHLNSGLRYLKACKSVSSPCMGKCISCLQVMMEVVAVSSAIYGLVFSMIICIATAAVFTGHIVLLLIVVLTILGGY